MSDSEQPREEWSDAIAQASEHVEQRGQAAQEAAERQRPKSQGPIVALMSVALVGVAIWNLRVISAPPDEIQIDERTHLGWFVVDAAEAIEDFRADEGRLPSPDEAREILEDDVVYATTGDGFTISVEAEDGETLSYQSTTSLDEWQEIHAPAAEEGT